MIVHALVAAVLLVVMSFAFLVSASQGQPIKMAADTIEDRVMTLMALPIVAFFAVCAWVFAGAIV